MKIILFVFSACCLAVALADSEDDYQAWRKLYDQSERECREGLKLEGKEIENAVSSRGCFEICMHNKFEHFNSDGTINWEHVARGDDEVMHNKQNRDYVERVYSNCLETAKGDACKIGYCLYQERLKH